MYVQCMYVSTTDLPGDACMHYLSSYNFLHTWKNTHTYIPGERTGSRESLIFHEPSQHIIAPFQQSVEGQLAGGIGR